MSEETKDFTATSEAGQSSDFSVTADEPEKVAGGAADEGSNKAEGETPKPDHEEAGSGNSAFKARLDRMRRREQEKYEAQLKANNDSWEKRFAELEARVKKGEKPASIRREDFKSDEEFMAAKRKDAVDGLMDALDKRNAEKEAKAAEEKSKQDEADAFQRKFAEKFSTRMKETMSPAQQQAVIRAVNNPDSEVNVVLSSNGGNTLQEWLMKDSENPADALLYLEQHPDKLDRLIGMSPRRQVQQLDILEMTLARARAEMRKKAQGNNAAPESRKAPVIGQFGGSTQAVTDDSQLSDSERVAKLIKAMRSR